MESRKSLAAKFKEAYKKLKKPLAYFIVFTIFVLELLSKLSIIPSEVRHSIILGLLVGLSIIIMEVFFQIYEEIVADKGNLRQIKSPQLYDEIMSLVTTNKEIKIQCIGVAGRNHWSPVIAKLLDKSNNDSLHELREFTVEIALISPEFQEQNSTTLEKYDAVVPIIKDIKRNQIRLSELYPNEEKLINLYTYNHIPNFVGFLIDGNYLFLNVCYWELENSQLDFRGAGTDYLIYDKNDKFGGSYYIDRFDGWFKHIKNNSPE